MNDRLDPRLHAYRPGSGAEEVPGLEEALRAAESDPEGAARLLGEAAFDEAFAAKLAAGVQPPHGLRDRIIATMEEAAAEEALPDEGKVIRPPFWRQPANWAVAAAILLVFALTFAYSASRPGDPTETVLASAAPGFLADFAAFSRQIDGLELYTRDMGEMKSFLATHARPTPGELPHGFSSLEGLGCRRVTIAGTEASLICFREGKVYHLFVTDAASYPAINPGGERGVWQVGDHAVATWSDAEHGYVLTVEGGTESLSDLL